ncbi:MFS transporter [Streptomyces sulphureus]|uniref:MFS transporter n=1 Tax=Streptomyces sulphureus TaxID=47758 RepID=UPI00035DC7C8|nr:MFS transporter [Streptomyces sulphureus]
MTPLSSRRRPRTTAPAETPLADSAFRVLLLATLCAFANYAPLLSVVPLWAADGGSQAGGVGAATGVTMATTVGAQTCIGRLLRRWTLRQLFASGALLLGLPTLAYPLSSELAWVLAISAVRGVGFGLVAVAGSALVVELVRAERRGRAVGWYGVAVGVPQIVLLPFAVWAAAHLGFTAVFVSTGLLAVLACPLALTLPKGTRTAPDSAPDDGIGQPARSVRAAYGPHTAPFTVLAAGACALGGITAFLPLVLTAPAAAPLALFAVSAGIAAGRYLAGAYSDRAGAGGRLGWYVAACALGMGGLAVLALHPAAAAALAVLPATCYGLGFGALQNDTLVLMFQRAAPGEHAAASTAWNMGFDGGTGVGAAGVGVLAHAWGVPGAFGVSAVLVAATLPLVPVARRARRRAG